MTTHRRPKVLKLWGVVLGTLFATTAAVSAAADKPELVVCADPNNLPFSNRAGQGFENKIVDLIAKDMEVRVRYVWWAQRRGYVRNTLNEAKCDLWPGIATSVSMVATTRPYYRSTYMFVSRDSARLNSLTLDDPRLRNLAIGVQMIGNDSNNTPPAHAIASRGIVDNVRGFMLYENRGGPNPSSPIIDAVASGDIDVALVWGPAAGYFARRSNVRMHIEAVTPAHDLRWPMTYDISIGVQKSHLDLLQKIDSVLDRRRRAIDTILSKYSVPLVLTVGED
jgi:mxaJ protein